MTLRALMKNLVEHTPEPIGHALVHIPFAWRLGRGYRRTQGEIRTFESLDPEAKKAYVLSRMRRIVEFAAHNVEFYRDLYDRRGFRVEMLQTFDDIRRIPVVTKADLRACELERRSTPQAGRRLWNTGGSTGSPLEFFVDADAWTREWAHMHHIWFRIGYRVHDLTLRMGGVNLRQPARFRAIYNAYDVNTYLEPDQIAHTVWGIQRRHPVRFLHGYPSTISEFARYCATEDPSLGAALRSTLRGIILSSEYPAPVYRDVIEANLCKNTLSFYGHSERCVLAPEKEIPFCYYPMHTYGYCEAIPAESGDAHLVGTSYYNTASPFIRYDTGDLIEPEIANGLMQSFEIKSGRTAEFVIDRNGRALSLTALVFGRHHKLFGYATFVQVCQDEPGKATVAVTIPPTVKLSADDIARDFDASNVALDLSFTRIPEPIRTARGKVPLLVRSTDLPSHTD